MNEQRTRKRREPLGTAAKGAIALCCLAAVAGVGGALAYLTDVDSVTNRFTVVPALDIDVVEERWDAHPDEDGDGIPDPAEELVPCQGVAKDPAIENVSGTQAWVFAEVAVPTEDVVLVEGDGLAAEAARSELFSYEVNDGWTEMGQPTFDEERSVTVHRYAWTSPVDPGERTGTIFDKVVFANLADNQLDGLADDGVIALEIGIDGFGIQTEGFGAWADAWSAYTAQNP